MSRQRGLTVEATAAAYAAEVEKFFEVHGEIHEPIAVDLGGSHPVVSPGCYHTKPVRDLDPNDDPQD